MVRKFLESYLTYTPTTLEKNWADALNMMTHNLRTLTLNQLRDQDIVSKVHDDEITSTFKLRSLEPVKGNPGPTSRLESRRSIVSITRPIHRPARGTVQRGLLQTERSERVRAGCWSPNMGTPDGGRKG